MAKVLKTSSKADSDNEKDLAKLQEAASNLISVQKYDEVIQIYDQILQIPDLTTENQASILIDRSSAYLMIDNKESFKMAEKDAQKAIELCPNSWKAYFGLAQIHIKFEEWQKAEETLEKALALNPDSKDIRDELSHVRLEIGILSRQDIYHPDYLPPSKEDVIQDISSRMGLSEEQIKQNEKLAMKNPKLADLLKAEKYRDGQGVEQDYVKAAVFFTKAALNEIPMAMYNLGKMYQHGQGVTRNFEQSVYWLTKAANSKPFSIYKSGVAEAQHALGLMYYEGIRVEQDYKKAVEWYEKAVQNGFGGSANNLGMLYKRGQGVEQSATKAFYYFKLAAEQGETYGMQNLADCYFAGAGTESFYPDIDEGMKWLRLAAEKGDGRAVQELQRREKLTDVEALVDSIKHMMVRGEENDSLNYKIFGKQIQEAANNESITAQRHLDIWKNLKEAMDAFKDNDSAKLVSALSKAIHLDHQIVEIPDMFVSAIKKRFKHCPNELDTVICYVKINTKNPQLCEIVQKYCNMFPDDEYLWEMYMGTFITFKRDPKGALRISKIALKRFPESLVMLYSHAIILCLQQPQTTDTIKALDAFLAAAPKDYRYVPACFYRKMYYYVSTGNKAKALSSFEDGLAAEKHQLPCYLPYRFPSKDILEKYYQNNKKTNDSGKGGIPFDTKRYEKVKLDPKRKALLLQNRELFISYAKEYGRAITFPETAPRPPCTPQPPNWSSNPKKITFKDMDPTKDKVYNGCLLEVRIIDWAFKMFSIQTKIEDENGDVHRFAIYNWPKTGNFSRDSLNAFKTFRPNVKMSIINPYHRMARDGQNTIRVEGREFVKLDTSMIDKLCHVCGKEGKTLPSCSSCKMTLYCSKECQKLDWTEFNHKGICRYVKMYANLM